MPPWPTRRTAAVSPTGHILAVRHCSVLGCEEIATSSPMTFACENGVQRVTYSVVCDHRPDCQDGSDEDFCTFPACNSTTHFKCSNGECLPYSRLCDDRPHCADERDETGCYSGLPAGKFEHGFRLQPGHLVIPRLKLKRLWLHYDEGSESLPLPAGATRCPPHLYRCAGRGLCLPVYTRCNGVTDCPDREDETGCGRYTCPGFYRCRRSQVCLSLLEICDGLAQCPQQDDEWFCHVPCPQGCQCLGWSYTCPVAFRAQDVPALRYLQAAHSGMQVFDLRFNSLLVYLSLVSCGLPDLRPARLPNLLHLDLARNRLRSLSHADLAAFPRLRSLRLSGNPVGLSFTRGAAAAPRLAQTGLGAAQLRSLDLSDVTMDSLHLGDLARFYPALQVLNLSHCGLRTVELSAEEWSSFNSPDADGDAESIYRNHSYDPHDVAIQSSSRFLVALRVLDARGNTLTTYPPELLRKSRSMREVYADNYKLCCPALLPAGFPPSSCHAPFDEVSSCDNLLRSDLYRAALYVFCAAALLGNVSSLIYRAACVQQAVRHSGFAVLVENLCAADALMGVYLLLVGAADRWFQSDYLWRDVSWRSSAVCRLAGALALTSREVSAFLVFVITLDRFLVLRFPFGRLRLGVRSAWAASGACWEAGLVLACVPLLPPAADRWAFYGQTGLCVPLPVTRRSGAAGEDYAFAVMVGLNFALFLLVAVGQAGVYVTVCSHHDVSKLGDVRGETQRRRARDGTLARRLLAVATADFLCWFPVGLLGLLAAGGAPIPGEVSVALAILVLPLNATLNPALYTFSLWRERRQQRREARMLACLREADCKGTVQ